VSGWVSIFNRIIQNVRIPVESLRIGAVGYNIVGADESAYHRVVVAGVVVVEVSIVQPMHSR